MYNYFLIASLDIYNNIVHFYHSTTCLATIMNAIMFNVSWFGHFFIYDLKNSSDFLMGKDDDSNAVLNYHHNPLGKASRDSKINITWITWMKLHDKESPSSTN